MINYVTMRWRSLLLWALGLLAGGALLALLAAYSGIYNVAASAGHPVWLERFLQMAKERSVKVNSRNIEPPELDTADLVPLGAAHFQGTCAVCHGAPGQPVNPVFGHMLPHPPDLQLHSPRWTRGQLFWIARHGIQFTGMPAWSGSDREDEVWAVVAFLEALPSMTAAEYLRHARGNSKIQPHSVEEIVNEGRPRLDLTACSRCHDAAGAAPTSAHIPGIAGQDEAYLKRALYEYRDDSRQSGFMEPVADDLSDAQIDRLAAYYSAMSPTLRRQRTSSEDRELGRRLAEQGDREHKIPACNSCHGRKRREDYPRLAGQSELYLKQQLIIWKEGGRNETPHGAMMSVVARRLTERQAAAAAAFFANQSPETAPPSRTEEGAQP